MSETFNRGNEHDIESFNWQSASRETADGGVQVARISQNIARSLFAGDRTIIDALDTHPEDDVFLLRQGPNSHSGISQPHAFTTTEWAAFMNGVDNNEFDPSALHNER